MRIGTWNVEYATGPKNSQRLELLRGADCDVWVLTETHDDLDLGSQYQCVSTTQRPDKRDGSHWVSIWSRISVIKRIEVADKSRTVALLVATPTRPLLVYGTVLPWHSDRSATPNAKNWSEHHRVIPEQAAEWKALRTQYPTAELCVAGDLNMSLVGKHYYGTKNCRSLLREGLQKANLVCTTETLPETTELSHPPIDHICLSAPLARGASVVQAWNGDQGSVRLSDHSGLVVEVTADAFG